MPHFPGNPNHVEDAPCSMKTFQVESDQAVLQFLQPRHYVPRAMIQRNNRNFRSTLVQHDVALVIIALLLSNFGCAHASTNQSAAIVKDGTYYFKMGREMSKLAPEHDWRSSKYRELSAVFEELLTALQKDVTNEQTHFNLARYFEGTGTKDNESAIKQYTVCLALNSENISALNNRALCKYKGGDKLGALQDLTTAISLDPRNSTLSRNRSIVYSGLSDKAHAKADLRQAKQIDKSEVQTSASKTKSKTGNEFNLQALPYFDLTPDRSMKPRDRISEELNLLTIAERFHDGISGLTIPAGAKDHSFLAFQHIATSATGVNTEVLKQYFDRATPSGKLFIAALIKKFDAPNGNLVLQELMKDQTPVRYVDGCCPEDLTVAIIAKHLNDQEGLRRLIDGARFWTMPDLFKVAPRLIAMEKKQPDTLIHAKDVVGQQIKLKGQLNAYGKIAPFLQSYQIDEPVYLIRYRAPIADEALVEVAGELKHFTGTHSEHTYEAGSLPYYFIDGAVDVPPTPISPK